MRLLTEDNVEIPVTKTKKPSFNNVAGRTWDEGKVFINGKIETVFLDTTRGRYLYFQKLVVPEHRPQSYYYSWYKIPMHNYHGDGLGDFNVDPFAIEPVKLRIK